MNILSDCAEFAKAEEAFNRIIGTIKPNPPLTDTPDPCPPLHASVGGDLSNVLPASPAGELPNGRSQHRPLGFSSTGDA